MKLNKIGALLIACSLFICGCGSNASIKGQQHARIMVMPSDQLLDRFQALSQDVVNGRTITGRDYETYYLNDPDAKFIIASIQDGFIEYGYPINDLEQTLKNIGDREIIDGVSGIKKDAKTILLNSAHPDIIIEVDYNYQKDYSTRSIDKVLSYSIRAIDAVTSKVVATIQDTQVKGGKDQLSSVKLMETALSEKMDGFTKNIDEYFSRIGREGRDITVRINVDQSSALSMKSELSNGDVLSDYIIDYMKVNTLGGAYNMSLNTASEMYFTDVRIKTSFDDGTQYSAYDYARDLVKAFREEFGVKCSNETQSLGDAQIIIH